MVKEPPRDILVNVTGGGWQLFKRTISLKPTPVDIRPENPVQTQYFTSANLLPIFSSQLSDLNVNYIAADTIFFKIERFADRKLAISLDSGSIGLRENFHIITPVFLEPDSVNFHGPSSLIEQLPDVFVVSLSNANINGSYDEELSLDMFSSSLIRKQPEVIHVRFGVEEFVLQSATVDIEMVNFPYDSTIYLSQNQVEVYFKVQKSFRNKLSKSDILILADLNNVQSGDTAIALELMNFPGYLRDVSLQETRIKVVYAE
jgi:YbbR domain-containing protein